MTVPDTGSVLRCNPDGTELEVFATGLRNPQELAFDEYGNLFTGDNNSDSGDRARWVYLVEGGDSGWRIGYQFIETPISRGPWNEERLWYPSFAGQAAYIVPPIANIADGPSGSNLRSRRHALTRSNTRNTSSSSISVARAVRAVFAPSRSSPREPRFSLSIRGNSCGRCWRRMPTLVPTVHFISATGSRVGKKPTRVESTASRIRRDVMTPRSWRSKRSWRREWRDSPAMRSAGLLAHADMRVRQEAQFELAGRGEEGWKILAQVARSSAQTLPRIHAIWGLGQTARTSRAGRPDALWDALGGLLADPDPEVRAQTAKAVGDAADAKALDRLIALLEDSSPRVRFFAAAALGKLGRSEAVGPLLRMIRANGDNDPYLRHAGCHRSCRIRQDRGVESSRAGRVAPGADGDTPGHAPTRRSRDRSVLERCRPPDRARGRTGDP